MTFEEAKQLLTNTTRCELRDHAFGDREISWYNAQGEQIAEGYSGGGSDVVYIQGTEFTDSAEVRQLMDLGTLGKVTRNDSTGPDVYQYGKCLPGLTIEGVHDELVNKG